MLGCKVRQAGHFRTAGIGKAFDQLAQQCSDTSGHGILEHAALQPRVIRCGYMAQPAVPTAQHGCDQVLQPVQPVIQMRHQ